MKVTDCPNCGGGTLYTTVTATPASGMMGPHLLPKLASGQFHVVVCEDCGLARFFVRKVDIQVLKASAGWTRIVDSAPVLGLDDRT